MSIGQRIRTLRKQQDLSIDELAFKLGKNKTTIYRYENGDIENLPLGILNSLADALNTTPAYLLGWETKSDDSSLIHVPNAPKDSIYMTQWIDEFGINAFDDDEYKKVLEYARFILSTREK